MENSTKNGVFELTDNLAECEVKEIVFIRNMTRANASYQLFIITAEVNGLIHGNIWNSCLAK